MTVLDDMTVALQLACLTEDRTDTEQRALLRVARRVDEDSNANVVGNARWGVHHGSVTAVLVTPLSTLERHVAATRGLDDGQHAVALKEKIPAGRHVSLQCADIGGCGFELEHPIHKGQ